MMFIISYLYHYIGQVCLRLLSSLFCRPLDISGINHALIVSPHPDDEVFGCGLLIQQLIAAKKKVSIVILSRGEAVHRKCCPLHEAEVIDIRQRIALRSNQMLGVSSESIHFLDFPDSRFSSLTPGDEQVDRLSNLVVRIAPDVLFLPHPLEYSPDHITATKIVDGLKFHIPIKHYFYCVWVWYHMPFYKSLAMKWNKACCIREGDKHRVNNKRLAIDSYMQEKAPCGIAYSGSLPALFLKAHRRDKELFFKTE